jgi:hypothetical protein
VIAMTETTPQSATHRRRLLPLIATGAVALAVAIAGCGGSSSTAAKPAQHSGQAATSGIPQGNGGDMDADNNGGPSDGDGNQ